jgi:hypothetical protein
MSGHKHATVTISQEEYRRLHEADMKKRFKEFANLNAQNSSWEAENQNLLTQLEIREQQLEDALAYIGQNTNQMDEDLLQELLAQNAMCFEGLTAAIQESATNFNDSLAMMSEDYSRRLQFERERFHLNLQSVIEDQEASRNREYKKEEAAQLWINRCQVMADFLQSQYEHERFAPGRLSRILRSLNFSENNLIEGFSESSIQGSQQIYLELSDLHFELEQTMIQWQTKFDMTFSAINELIQQMEANAQVYALGLQGEELPIQVDLDYWTNGRFHQLLDHARQLISNLVQDQSCLTLDDIDQYFEQKFPVIREYFESIVYDARLNALNSQLRMNIAEKALQALEVHGFTLEEAGYSENDMRSQFNAILDSPDGSQVVIQVVPTERINEELSNELVVITTHPTLKTEHEARLRWEELNQALNQYNLRVSRPEVLPSPSPSLDHSGSTLSVEQKITRSER